MSTLQACLEEVARLGPGYILNEAGYEWSAEKLLRWLKSHSPALLQTPTYLLRPQIRGTGAIYEIQQDGEALNPVPLYWIEWRPLPVTQFWAANALLLAEMDG
jgi:hypothetical protein